MRSSALKHMGSINDTNSLTKSVNKIFVYITRINFLSLDTSLLELMVDIMINICVAQLEMVFIQVWIDSNNHVAECFLIQTPDLY